MALAYQYGIPKEKGNDHAVATREIQNDQAGGDTVFASGVFVAISDEESMCTSPKIRNFADADDVPAGVMIKVDITKASSSICLSGRSVPVRIGFGATVEVGDELELNEQGRVIPLASGKFIGVCVKTGIKAMDQTGKLIDTECCLIDFKL